MKRKKDKKFLTFRSGDSNPWFSKMRARDLNYLRWWDQIQARKLKFFDFSNYKVFGWFYIGPLYNVHLLSPTVWLLTTVLLGVDRAEVSSLKIWWNGSRRGNREFKGFHHLPSLLPSTMRPKSLWNRQSKMWYHSTLLFYQIEPLKNGATLIFPSSITKTSSAPNTKIIFEFLWGILEGRTIRAQPSQPILKNCQNGTF